MTANVKGGDYELIAGQNPLLALFTVCTQMHRELYLVHERKQIFHFENLYGFQNFCLACVFIRTITRNDSFHNIRYIILTGPRPRSRSWAQAGPALMAGWRDQYMGGALALAEQYQDTFTVFCGTISILPLKYLEICFDIHDIAAEPDSFQIDSFWLKPLIDIQTSRSRDMRMDLTFMDDGDVLSEEVKAMMAPLVAELRGLRGVTADYANFKWLGPR